MLDVRVKFSKQDLPCVNQVLYIYLIENEKRGFGVTTETPSFSGGPHRIRTCDQLIKSHFGQVIFSGT